MQDGVLSDVELNDFQVHCFAVPLQPEELAGVKAVVSQKLPEVDILPPFSAAVCEEEPQHLQLRCFQQCRGSERGHCLFALTE